MKKRSAAIFYKPVYEFSKTPRLISAVFYFYSFLFKLILFMKALLQSLLISFSVFILLTGCRTSGAEQASNFTYNGKFSFVVKHLPHFSEFPEVEPPKSRADDIDWSSHADAWTFRTILREGLKKGPNFAGKYAVVTHGCGSSCQVNWIINTETGRVIGTIGSSWGVDYRLDSRMLVKHMPSQESLDYELTNSATFGTIDYYLIVGDELYELLKLHPPTIEWDHPSSSKYRGDN